MGESGEQRIGERIGSVVRTGWASRVERIMDRARHGERRGEETRGDSGRQAFIPDLYG